jgi:hypothetical protein
MIKLELFCGGPEMKLFFDEYEWRARVLPGMLVISPVLSSFWGWSPNISLWNTLGSLLAMLGGGALLARVVRSEGKRKEPELYRDYGSRLPTTTMLRHKDNTIDSTTKARYRKALESRIANLSLPSAEDEEANPLKADELYDSAIKGLLESTRDKKQYPLVFEENVNYGFARNLWAMKKTGLVFSVLAAVVNLVSGWFAFGTVIKSIPIHLLAVEVYCIVLIFVWIFHINPRFVRLAALSYSRALLAACDRP